MVECVYWMVVLYIVKGGDSQVDVSIGWTDSCRMVGLLSIVGTSKGDSTGIQEVGFRKVQVSGE